MRRTAVRACVLACVFAYVGVLPAASPAGSASSSTSAPGVVIYTKDNAPAAPRLEDLPLKESLSQYGITWTFEKPVRVGQFVNGDYYVVGPVTVTAVDPKTLRDKEVPEGEIGADEARWRKNDGKFVRNGSMHNPPAKPASGLDSGIREYFRRELTADFPVQLKPGDALLSSISMKMGEQVSHINPSTEMTSRARDEASSVRTAAVLTCLAEPVPADAFRPSFCDREHKTIRLARDLKRELLLSLARVAETPKIADYARKTRRVWFDVTWFNFSSPVENVPRYGQANGRMMSNSGLLLCCDFTPREKEPLLIHLVQIGIDYWGVVRGGHIGWGAFGGHNSGRKFPIVFAGMLLGDDEMARVSKTLPKVGFGEDEQTAYGDCWTGAKVVWTGHSGIVAATGKPHADSEEGRKGFGPYEHITPDKWTRQNLISEGYRTANTSSSWIGQALTIRLMHAEEIWAHDAFFDYCDRWMQEDDTPFRHEIAKTFPGHAPDESKFQQQRRTWDGWVDAMYAKYRPTLKAPMDGWKQKHDDRYYRNAIGTTQPATTAPKP